MRCRVCAAVLLSFAALLHAEHAPRAWNATEPRQLGRAPPRKPPPKKPPASKGPSDRDKAISAYREKAIAKGVAWSGGEAAKLPSLGPALACLRKTTPKLQLRYPADAEAHFQQIRERLAPWAQHAAHHPHGDKKTGFHGPWIENAWITHFEGAYDRRARNATLADVFGPFVPLFVPFVDLWVGSHWHYPNGLVDALLGVLRADVPYIVVSQNDEGLTGKCELVLARHPNVLVLSAGGYGHVPVPLFKQDEPPRADAAAPAARKFAVSYVGSLGHAPDEMRRKMEEVVNGESKRLGFRTFVGGSPTWRDVMADSRASLCPRGFGRTSYHLVETAQMGLLPIHVYLDAAWVPYAALFRSFGWATDVRGLAQLLERVHAMGADELARRERVVRALRASHFTLNGTMHHIRGFMLDEGGDLECQVLPETIRAAGAAQENPKHDNLCKR